MNEMAPSPKRKSKASKSVMVKPAEFFVTSEKLYVDPDFVARMDLAPCLDDKRKLSSVCPPLPRNMNDTSIDIHAGGKGTLRKRRATLPQLMHEVDLAITGGDSIFKKGGYYLIYLEGLGGDLYPVRVCWRGGQLNLYCYRFGEVGKWLQCNQVCGN
jgi:hypothetical protein